MSQTLSASLKHIPREVEKHKRVEIEQTLNPVPHNTALFMPRNIWVQRRSELSEREGFKWNFVPGVESTGHVATLNEWPIMTDAYANEELYPRWEDVDHISMVVLEETAATRVRNVIAEHLGVDFDQLENKSPLSFFGADDLDCLEISLDLEDEFSVTGLHRAVDDALAEYIDPMIAHLIKAVEDFLETKKA